MCRFNLILIKEGNAEELLAQEGYQKFNVNLPGYKAYQKGYCNCGSFVGSLIEKKGMRYDDAIAERKREKQDRLYQIRDFMNQPGYRERRDDYVQNQEKFSEKLQVFYERINEYELNLSKEISEKYDDQNYRIQLENMHSEINKMFTEVEGQPEYKLVQEAYMKFQQDNDLMNESLCYFLTKEEEENANAGSIPLSELLGLDEELNTEEVESIELEQESNVIDEVMKRTEQGTFEKDLGEYNSYYKLFSDLLKKVSSFLFTTVWSEPNELKRIKTISIDSLVIDDLAFLDFDEMICIEK